MRAVPPRRIAILQSLAVSAALVGSVTGASALTQLTPTATASVTSYADRAANGPVAVAARRVYLVENAKLSLTGEGETSLTERGQALGTFNAPVSAHLKLSPGHVSGLFTIYPKGGSVSGKAQARYVVRGSVGYYGGTLTITGGTGIYRHASGSQISISGTINHLNFDLTVKAHGWTNL